MKNSNNTSSNYSFPILSIVDIDVEGFIALANLPKSVVEVVAYCNNNKIIVRVSYETVGDKNEKGISYRYTAFGKRNIKMLIEVIKVKDISSETAWKLYDMLPKSITKELTVEVFSNLLYLSMRCGRPLINIFKLFYKLPMLG